MDTQTGLRKIYTPDGRAVLGLGDQSREQEQKVLSGSDGTASDIQVANKKGRSSHAMSSTDFKALIRRNTALQGNRQ